MPLSPYPVCIRWPVDCQSGAGHRGPSMRPEASTIPPALWPMPLAVTSIGAQRSRLHRVIDFLFSYTGEKTAIE